MHETREYKITSANRTFTVSCRNEIHVSFNTSHVATISIFIYILFIVIFVYV